MTDAFSTWIRISIDPIVYLASLFITVAFLLDAMGHNILWLFSVLDIANEALAISEIIAAIIPISIMSLLSILFGFVRFVISVKSAADTGSIEKVQSACQPIWQFILVAFFSCILLLLLVLQLMGYKTYFEQSVELKPGQFRLLQFQVILTIVFTMAISFLLSARDVVNSNIQESLRDDLYDR